MIVSSDYFCGGLLLLGLYTQGAIKRIFTVECYI